MPVLEGGSYGITDTMDTGLDELPSWPPIGFVHTFVLGELAVGLSTGRNVLKNKETQDRL
jgi:hypothetical protein